jgi:hypothetical protein
LYQKNCNILRFFIFKIVDCKFFVTFQGGDQAARGALLNQGMNANGASYPKVSLSLGFKNPRKEDSSLKSATPNILNLMPSAIEML